MTEIKDKFFLGAVAGVIVNIPLNILDYILYKLNISQYHIWHIAASVYFPKSQVITLPALIVGMLTHFILVAILGIAILYLLYYTGTDYYWAKGLAFSMIAWLFIFGIVLQMKISRINPVDFGTNLTHIGAHIIFGILVAWVIVTYGKEALETKTL